MKRRVAVRGIFVKNGKILCVKLKPYRHYIKGQDWITIGGGLDSGESLIPALKREIFEETGVTPDIGSLLYVQQFYYADMEHLEFFFNINNVNDYMEIDLKNTSHGFEEIAEIDFVDPKEQVILPTFLNKIDFSNFNPDSATQFFSEL